MLLKSLLHITMQLQNMANYFTFFVVGTINISSLFYDI